MKRLTTALALVLAVCLLAGCAGTPVVYYSDCTCPSDAHTVVVPTEGAVKTGLAIVADAGKSKAAEVVEYDVTIVAVTVDDGGVIRSCIIDSAGPTVRIDAAGAITSDLSAPIQTKNEKGDSYGMVAYGNAKYEWYQQAEALADYAEGKTLEQLKQGISGGYASDADLASTASIYLGGYVAAIEKAVSNAQHLGAQTGDELRLATIFSAASSTSATAEKNGTVQLDGDVTALTVSGGVITSCVIDSLQAKVPVDAAGAIDLSKPFQTKNELGEAYGMKAYGSAKYEWNEQAAAFARYVTGKTAADVAGIAVTEGKPAQADLSGSVTIAIGGFQALIAKALG